MKQFVSALTNAFEPHRNSEKALWQKAYMKHKFEFLGIQKPIRSAVEKAIFQQYPIITQAELVETLYLLWDQDAREYQYAACELAYRYQKLWTPDILPVFEHMIRTKAWWDTVDDIAVNLVGTLVKQFPHLTTTMDTWIHDDFLWIRRTAILHQLKYKHDTDSTKLFEYCRLRMHEKYFFMRKVIGWVLREYSKTNPTEVKEFIESNRVTLSGLSIREGSKYIKSGD